jgi:CheY-like chemotaxis protein
MLTNWRMRPTLAAGAREALAAMDAARRQKEPFPLALVDAHMPELDGFALVERIRRSPRLAGATIMMLSSAEAGGEARRCRELGVGLYLTKPVRQSQLLDAILTALPARAREGHATPAPPLPAAGSGGRIAPAAGSLSAAAPLSRPARRCGGP